MRAPAYKLENRATTCNHLAEKPTPELQAIAHCSDRSIQALERRCRSGDKVLLLERNSKHNDRKWGLPGGNVEVGDPTLLDTASREAKEELGDLPQYEIVTEIKTRQVHLG